MLYISHLIEDEKIETILKNYDVGLESIEFAIGYNLDNLEDHINLYRNRIEKISKTKQVDISIHGPFWI